MSYVIPKQGAWHSRGASNSYNNCKAALKKLCETELNIWCNLPECQLMPISIADFCRNINDLGTVGQGVDQLQTSTIQSQWNVFLSRLASIQTENYTLERNKKRKIKFRRKGKKMGTLLLEACLHVSLSRKHTHANTNTHTHTLTHTH